MAENTPRHNFEKIDSESSPDVASDINNILSDIDGKLLLDRQGPTLPSPGKTNSRIFSDDLMTEPMPEWSGGSHGDYGPWVYQSNRRVHIDLGSSWKQISPPEDRSLSQDKIIANSIPIDRMAYTRPTYFDPSLPFILHVATSGSLMWYKDPYGFVYLEGSVECLTPGQFTGPLVTLGDPPNPPLSSGTFLFSRWDRYGSEANCGVAVNPTDIVISKSGSTQVAIGLGMIRYKAAT